MRWPLLFLLFFFYYPLWTVLKLVDRAGLAFLKHPYVLDRLQGAVWQALLSVLLTLAVALPLAYHFHRHHNRWTRLQLAMHAAPFVFPVFIVIYGLQALFGNRGWTQQWFGIDVLDAIGPIGTIALAHAYFNIGFATRILTNAFDSRPTQLEAAAKALGASPREVLARVTVPLLLPRLAAVALLVFFFAFTSFAIVLTFGAGEVGTFETLLYQQLGGISPDRNRAAALAILQLALNAVLLFAYLRLSQASLPAERPERRPGSSLGGWLVVALFSLPVIAVLQSSFSWDVWRSLWPGHPRTPAGFDLPVVLGRTLLYATASSLLAIVLSLGLVRAKRGGLLATIPLGTSSVVLGLGMLFAFGANAHPLLDWRGSKWLIILAHTLVAFPFTYRVLQPAYASRDRNLEDAARVLGAGRDLLWRVQLPLLRPAILVALGFSFAMSLGDFGASLLLMRSDNMALSVWIPQLDRPFDAFAHQQSLAASGLLMLMTVAAYVLIERFRNNESDF
ncbi:MAG: ABC transporter permease [Thermoplasmatota archaeon]